jgi:hypothetical protein
VSPLSALDGGNAMARGDASEDSAASEDVCPLSASSSVSPFVVLDFIVIAVDITRQDGIPASALSIDDDSA